LHFEQIKPLTLLAKLLVQSIIIWNKLRDSVSHYSVTSLSERPYLMKKNVSFARNCVLAKQTI